MNRSFLGRLGGKVCVAVGTACAKSSDVKQGSTCPSVQGIYIYPGSSFLFSSFFFFLLFRAALMAYGGSQARPMPYPQQCRI